MSRVKYILPFLIIPFLYFLSSFQNQSSITELTEKILSMSESYVNDFPEEKVFVHLDKKIYAAGDMIWFSAYVTAGSPDLPSPLSKTVYVDLLDNEGNLLQQRTVKIEEGHGNGDFKLDNFTKEGIYHIKAYSYWSKGFGAESVFETKIEIFEPYNLRFQPTVVFEKKENGNDIYYRAKINAVDRNLQPLKGEKLTYGFVSAGKQIKEGSIILDDNGANSIEINLPLSALDQVTQLVLTWNENEEYGIDRKFILPFPSGSVDIQFLPEGGDLISGFNNKVAVRAVYPDGSPVQLTGKINTGEEEINFSTNEWGLGEFSFTPKEGQNYVGKISANEAVFEIKLPAVKVQGINLAVDNSKEALLNILVQANDFKSISPTGEGLLVVHARGRIGHMQVINLSNGVTGARINKANLAPGINQVTIFEPNGNALAERLVYIPTPERKIKLDASQVETKPRGKNSWKLTLDGEGFEKGFYSVSITDADEFSNNFSSNIISYLKMESELRGHIHSANLLFGEIQDEEALDLIMLTHGWRRFTWQSVLTGKFENPNFIEQGINITGTIKPKANTKKGVTGGMINVFSKGKEDDFLAIQYNETGKFIIDDMIFSDTTLLTISINDKKMKEFVELDLDAPIAKYEKWIGFKPLAKGFEVNPVLRDYLVNAEKRRQASAAFDEMDLVEIDEFVVQSQKYVPATEEVTRVYGKGDMTLVPSEIGGFEGYFDIWQLLQGRFPGVNIKPNPMGSPSITIRGAGSLNALSPIFLLDNVPVDAQFLSAISPRDMAAIDVFKDGASLAMFGSAGAGGVIAIYTKRGNGIVDTGDGIFNIRFPGYSTAKEFYLPKYDTETIAKPDFRSTLYWNPKLKLVGNTANIEFFNSDLVQRYTVVIQGMDQFGRLSYLEMEIGS
ncbi:TonB-dependent receptor plug domain-containing protein [Aquiflexum sp. TKW24L]|uniref:TonB-dependent receptor plug domain-containing protein n=1 Tax=Aquiflexum sp. TKW24L TaxID=2942212 RepID=UPI0020BE3B0F|nr:TonB-dependent receptor plug domain-containing protein [Aquiflexum sp. TKW24L]MCL6261627.1 TonB-dependent receptor plug domain-containing protein [Aquiflexum sp. TKW24L]